MKNFKFVILAFIFVYAGQSFAQSEADKNAWMAYMTPTENHKVLAKDVGMWKTEMTNYMDPKAAPLKSTGTAETSMILGDRYQQSIYKGDVMGMAFEGISLLGYDDAKKVFVNSWVDNMGTGIMMLEGKWEKPGKTIVYTGKCTNPKDGKDMKVRQIVTIESETIQHMEMYMTEGGKEIKTLEVRMTKI